MGAVPFDLPLEPFRPRPELLPLPRPPRPFVLPPPPRGLELIVLVLDLHSFGIPSCCCCCCQKTRVFYFQFASCGGKALTISLGFSYLAVLINRPRLIGLIRSRDSALLFLERDENWYVRIFTFFPLLPLWFLNWNFCFVYGVLMQSVTTLFAIMLAVTSKI